MAAVPASHSPPSMRKTGMGRTFTVAGAGLGWGTMRVPSGSSVGEGTAGTADTAGTESGRRVGAVTHCSTPVSRSTEVPATGVVNSCTGTSSRASTTAHKA